MSDRNDINDILKELDSKMNETPEETDVPEEQIPDGNSGIRPEETKPENNDIPVQEDTPEPVQPEMQHTEMRRAPQRSAGSYQPRRSGSRPARTPDGRPVNRNAGHKKKKKKKKGRMSTRLSGVLLLITLIFGTSVILSLVIIAFGKDMLGIGQDDSPQWINVEEGATTEEIAQLLKDEDIIISTEAFKLFLRLRNFEGGYIPGEHSVRPNMAYETLISELTEIKIAQQGESVEITFPEGINLIDAANKLEENGVCNANDFIFYFNSGGYGLDFEELLPTDTSLKFKKMEGYLFPDTYIFSENSEPETVCQKIYYNFNTKMTEERINKMKSLNLTLDQLITFASIVQQEAGNTADMEMIASVFWNRLEHSDTFPKLESDPTKNYSERVIRPNMEYYDKTIAEAYDTYKSPGLPPGAICNPGVDAIDAVLAHKPSDYYYFIANINTKVTYFAATYEEHLENEARIEEEYEQARQEAAAAAAAEGN